MRSPVAARLAVVLALGAAAGCSSGSSSPAPNPLPDPATFSEVSPSCAYLCPIDPSCPEVNAPYVCQNTGDWKKIPHADSCAAWDGTFPAPAQGQCTASAPSGDAIAYAGPDSAHPGTVVLPDGRRIVPAGADWVFSESDLQGGLTTFVTRIPATPFVATVDDGPGDHAVRLVDSTKIGSGSTPVAGYVNFADPKTLNAAAAFVPPDLLYVATDDGVVQALTVDATKGTIAEDDARSITLPMARDGNGNVVPWYVAGLAVSPNGKRLAVTGVFETTLLLYDVDPASATVRQLLGQTDLGDGETFAVAFDPNDAAGGSAYVSMWGDATVVQVDVSNPASPKVAHKYMTDADPEGLAFLDARWMAVADDFGDSISMVDRTSGTVTSVPIDVKQPLHGAEPTALAWDATNKRLYAVLGGMNAVAAFDVDTTKAPPAVTPAGSLPSGWWPSGVVVMDDGSLVVSEMRGHGTGPRPLYFDIGDSDIDSRMRGGIQHVPAPSANDLTAGATAVAAADTPARLAGSPAVSCPQGASDFPLPATNDAGPSSVIQHIIFVLRENKGFDGLFGDMPGVNGDPSYTLKQTPGEMDEIWHNLRTLAASFSFSDNYYTDAIYSTQGHVWATYGRTSDFDERTWAISGSGRNARLIPAAGVDPVGRPVEGSLFDWLVQNQVHYDLLGEIVGQPKADTQVPPAIDPHYPGGPFQNIGYNDLPKACYAAGRLRVTCDLGAFVYMTLPNDHTFGVSSKNPTPETFCAVNDEATGMLADAVSHSPLWASTLVVITEDDPSQGGEHVDSHRAPVVFVSPWVKHGYVSKTHIDIASIHKLFAHVLGKPYPNAVVANAALPFDMFTSTPDFTPYTYVPRTWPLACGPASGMSQRDRNLAETWDFDEPDEQPGLDDQVTRWMRTSKRPAP